MAFHYVEAKKYDLDIEEIHKHLSNHPWPNFTYYNQWIEGWINVFKFAEKDTDIQVNNLIETGFPDFQVFTKEVHVGNANFFFNFIVQGANDYVKKSKVKPIKVKAKRFSEDIDWTEEPSGSTHNLHDPIYITALPLSHYKYVVIDGNHRLTECLAKGEKEINCIDIPPMDILNRSILLFSIDKALYAFFIEAEVFKRHVIQNKFSHKEIFEASNIHNAFKAWRLE